jgi:hypothetical protein
MTSRRRLLAGRGRRPLPVDVAVAGLRSVTADLDGYIARRAAELAAPVVARAREEAAAVVARAEDELRRRDDLAAELRRHAEAMERQLSSWRRATGCRSVADYQLARLAAPQHPSG